MAPRYSFSLSLLVFCLVTLAAKPISSFSLKRFDKDANFILNGDAEIVDGGSSVKITKPSNYSVGRVMYRNPFKFVDEKRRKPMSFSTDFEFSISPENGDGLAFVLLPNVVSLGVVSMDVFANYAFGISLKDGVLVIGFHTLMNVNRVGIDAGGNLSVKMNNVSSVGLVLNSGKKLHSWIDYEASSKRLEVRLSDSGERPYDPLLSYQINLSEMWKEEAIFVGLSSSNGNSTQSASVYSWNFRLRHVPTWFHSEPLDPQYSYHRKPQTVQERSGCVMRILTALMFGIGCGVLTVFIVLFLKTIFASKSAVVVPAEYPIHMMELGYEKIKIVKKVTADVKKAEP